MEVRNHPNKLLYPSMVIAAIAVTVFSLLGIATLTGALPFAHSTTQSQAEQYRADLSEQEGSAPKSDSRRVQRDEKLGATDQQSKSKSAVARCNACGVVESVRAVEVKGKGTGVGVVAGGVTGALLGNGIGQGNGRTAATVIGAAGGAYAGNEIEKNVRKHTSYRIRVRMGDDSIRTLYQRDLPGVSTGDRVKIVDGTIVQQS